jgi:microcystin-dependent protein
MSIAPVPYSFQNTPNGFTIPLDQLDANFTYLVNAVNGPLTISPSMLTTGGPTWDATGKLVSQGTLVTGNGNITSLAYPTNVQNIGLNGFTFNVGTSTPVQMTTAGQQINGSIKITQVTPSGVLTINAPNVGINTSWTFPPNLGYAGYVLTTDGAGNTSWLAPSNLGVKSFSTGTTGLTAQDGTSGAPLANTPVDGNVILAGTLLPKNGGTGISNATPVAGSLFIGNGAGYTLNTLTAGTGCTIDSTTTPGQITISLANTFGVTTVSGGTTGLTFTPSSGNAVMTGTLNETNGGTGLTALGSGVQSAMGAAVDTPGGLVTYSGGNAAGQVAFFAMQTPPVGWLFCGGQAVSRTTYAVLFAAIGTTFGPGDGSTTFNLPNLQGQFIRGWDSAGSVDPARTFGSAQADSFESHTHTANVTDPGHSHTCFTTNPAGTAAGGPSANPNGQVSTPTSTNTTGITVTNANTGGTETRPVNIALYPCIKY